MKRNILTLTTVTVIVFVTFFLSISLSVTSVEAQTTYVISNLDHTVSVLYNGFIVVNDTYRLSGQPSTFLMGFPYQFNPYLLSATAYQTNDRSKSYLVKFNVPLENEVGFSGLEVDLPQQPPEVFTVETVFSNALLVQNPQNATTYLLTFPTFPTLTTQATSTTGLVTLPSGSSFLQGTITTLNYSEQNLSPFTYNVSLISFDTPSDALVKFEVGKLSRVVSIDEFGRMHGSDSYFLTNKATGTLNTLKVTLPQNVSNLAAKDQLGRTMTTPVSDNLANPHYSLTFLLAVESEKSTGFTLNYDLSADAYLSSAAGTYTLSIDFFDNLDYYVDNTMAVLDLPEGAKLTSFQNSLTNSNYRLDSGVYEDSASVIAPMMFSLKSYRVDITYGYNPLWAAFRPTTWALTLVFVGALFVIAGTRPGKVITGTTSIGLMRLRPEEIKTFVEGYEEKMRITSEIDSLENRVQKGKIPRRRYKVQKVTLETRMSTISRNLGELKGKMHASGGHYADLMDQLEVAETEIVSVETTIKAIDTRQERGEMSLEAYRKALGDNERRKEKAEAAINGILLRLREEIR